MIHGILKTPRDLLSGLCLCFGMFRGIIAPRQIVGFALFRKMQRKLQRGIRFHLQRLKDTGTLRVTLTRPGGRSASTVERIQHQSASKFLMKAACSIPIYLQLPHKEVLFADATRKVIGKTVSAVTGSASGTYLKCAYLKSLLCECAAIMNTASKLGPPHKQTEGRAPRCGALSLVHSR